MDRIKTEHESALFIDVMPELRDAARESDKFFVTINGDVRLKDDVEKATLTVTHP